MALIVLGRNTQGLLHPRERRRPPRLEAARAVLRGLADLPRRPRPGHRRDLRRGGERVARRRRLAQHRPRRDAGSSRARGSPTTTTGLKLSKVSGLTAAHGRVLAGAEAAGRVREPRRRRDLVAPEHARRPAGPRALERPGEPAARPPRRPGDPARTPTTPARFWAIVQGFGIFETTDDGASWTPRNRGLRADWPLEHPEVGYCVHKLVMSPADHDRMYQQNHCRHAPQRRRRPLLDRRSPRACRREFGFAAAAHPHDRDTFYVIPLDPGHGRCMPDGQRRRLAHERRAARAGSGSTRACRSATRTSACCARAWRSTRSTRRASTSARAPARCSRAPTRARAGTRSRATCRRSRRSRWRWSTSHGRPPPPTDAAAALRRPAAPARRRRGDGRRGDRRGSTSAGPACATGCASPGPSLRRHINVYVDRERAGLDTALAPGSRVDVIAAISGG